MNEVADDYVRAPGIGAFVGVKPRWRDAVEQTTQGARRPFEHLDSSREIEVQEDFNLSRAAARRLGEEGQLFGGQNALGPVPYSAFGRPWAALDRTSAGRVPRSGQCAA
jgi:hypothetical protein